MTEIEKSNISIKTVAFIVISVVSATFSLTTIYNKFLLQHEVIQELREDVEYNKDRGDKLRKRLGERLDELEKPNSDKGKK